MKRSLATSALALALAGCGGGSALHTVGPTSEGGMRKAAEAFESYLLTYEPLNFALSPDGKFFYYTFCTKNCLQDINPRKYAVDHCNIYAIWKTGWTKKDAVGHENSCRIFADGEKVVWDKGIDGPLNGPLARYLK